MLRVMAVIVLTIFTCYSSNAEDARDSFVYVVALEKESPDELCTMWNPTLYKIRVEKGEIVKQMKIADQGAPISCESVGNTNIRVILYEGTFSNGTRPGKRITREFVFNKETMTFVESKTVRKIDEKKVPIEELLKLKKVPTAIISSIPKEETFLGNSSIGSPVFVLSNYLQKRDLSVKILDGNSFREIGSISLNVGARKLGGFSGVVNTALLEDQFLICLFRGDSSIDKFAPGYVMIVDIATKIVKWVSIGSDPALGISY